MWEGTPRRVHIKINPPNNLLIKFFVYDHTHFVPISALLPFPLPLVVGVSPPLSSSSSPLPPPLVVVVIASSSAAASTCKDTRTIVYLGWCRTASAFLRVLLVAGRQRHARLQRRIDRRRRHDPPFLRQSYRRRARRRHRARRGRRALRRRRERRDGRAWHRCQARRGRRAWCCCPQPFAAPLSFGWLSRCPSASTPICHCRHRVASAAAALTPPLPSPRCPVRALPPPSPIF